MTLFLILLLIFILVPVGRVFLAVYRAKRRSQRMWEQFNNNANAYRQQQQRSGGYSRQSQPQQKKKKIGRDVGEYVDFEEISGSSTTQSQQSTSTKQYHEQQVTDAEWEDIP